MGKRGPRDIEFLSRRQRAVIFLRVQGKTHAEIAEFTGYTRSWVAELCNSSAGKAHAQALLFKSAN